MSMFPAWVLDDSPIPDPLGHGERAVACIRALEHPKSRLPGQAFDLVPWMERIVRRIYGPVDESGNRVVRTVVILLPRGNRKTSLGAALALLHAVGPERVPGGQVLCAAADRKQARIAFEEARDILRTKGKLGRVEIVDSRNKIVHRSGATLEAIASEAGTQHGRTPSFCLVDELHAWPKRDLWDVLRTGLVKTAGSLLVVISTAGRGQTNIAWDIVEYARKVARGDILDSATLPILFETDAEADWRDEALWRRANPGLAHGFPDIAGMRQLAREAESRPADRDAFRQLHLNVWLDGAATPWLDMAMYDEGAAPIDLDALVGEPCWVGVDLSSTSDLTAVVAAFRGGAGEVILVPRFFVPEGSIRRRQERDQVPYIAWRDQGFLVATPGDVVDYGVVEQYARDLAERHRVVEATFDAWNAQATINRLTEAGLPVTTFGQGYKSMSPACKEVERLVIGRKLRHGGDPVLRWCFGNVAIDTDPAGNIKPTKARAREKIDGAVAAAMAVARATADDNVGSIYDDVEQRPDGLLSIFL